MYVHKSKFISQKQRPSSSSHDQLRELVNFVNIFLNVILDHSQNRQSGNFKSSRWRMFFKIGVLKNVDIFPGKHLCQSYFLIKLQAWRSAISLKRDSNTGVFLWILQNFKNTYFEEHLRPAASVLLIMKLVISIGYFFLIKNITWDSFRVYSVLIINRNHSNTFYCLTYRKIEVSKTCLNRFKQVTVHYFKMSILN